MYFFWNTVYMSIAPLAGNKCSPHLPHVNRQVLGCLSESKNAFFFMDHSHHCLRCRVFRDLMEKKSVAACRFLKFTYKIYGVSIVTLFSFPLTKGMILLTGSLTVS